MKAATSTERVKASKLRAKEASGKKLSPEARRFLANYDREHPPKRPPSRSSPGSTVRPRVEVSSAPAASSRPPLDKSNDRELDFGKPQPAAPATPPDPAAAPPSSAPASTSTELSKHDPTATNGCPVGPGCPGCFSMVGPVTCITTGRKQWPEMDEDGALGLGGLVLGGMTYLGKVFRSDHALVKFTEEEHAHFSKVLSKFIYKRASWAGQANDITALVFVGGVMIAKVATSEPPSKDNAATSTSSLNGQHRAPNA